MDHLCTCSVTRSMQGLLRAVMHLGRPVPFCTVPEGKGRTDRQISERYGLLPRISARAVDLA
jgi:hypothetical protein